MENIYYINVRVDNPKVYDEIVTVFKDLQLISPYTTKLYKVKLKNEKYIQDISDNGLLIHVYTSNLIYLEEL